MTLVAIYNRCLSPGEVAWNHRTGIGADRAGPPIAGIVREGLVALYTFCERAGDIVGDIHGTIPAIPLLMPKNISIPTSQSGTYKRFLNSTFVFDSGEAKDILVNVLAFLPFGFMLHGILRKRYGWTFRRDLRRSCVGLRSLFYGVRIASVLTPTQKVAHDNRLIFLWFPSFSA